MSDGYITFPEVYDRRRLNTLYREIPLKDTTSRMLRKYFNAMANLYGIITVEKAWDIIHSQCPRMVTEQEFLVFVEIARHECEDYYILNAKELYGKRRSAHSSQREIIDVYLFDTGKDMYTPTKQSQQGCPYYIPPKQELLRYDDPDYYEPTQATERLAEFFSKELHLDDRVIYCAFQVINEKIRYLDPTAQSAFPDLEEFGVSFSNRKQLEKFAQLYTDVHNSWRMQSNCGFTPIETLAMLPPEERIPRTLSFGPGLQKEIADGTINAADLRAALLSIQLPSEEMRQAMLRQIAEIEAAHPPQKREKRE